MKRLLNMQVQSIDAVTTIFSEKGRYFQNNERENYGISFCKSGKIIYRHNGTETVSEPGTAVILPKGACYSLVGAKSGDFPIINFQCTMQTPICEFISVKIHNPERFFKSFEKIKLLHLTERNHLKTMAEFYKLLDMLVAQLNETSFSLSPLIAYIEENYSNSSLSNEMLSESLNISEVYMRRLFKNQFGTTPKQYILDIRLQKATQLLTQTNLSVTEIAESCGFSNLYHFSRAFKNRMGDTPLKYRVTTKNDISLL